MARTLEQIKQDMVSYILSLRSDIVLVDGVTQQDVSVSATAMEFQKFETLLDFEDRTRNFTEFQNLINDDTFKANFATVLGFKPDGTQYTSADVDTLISQRLDAYVQDMGESRSGGSASTGFETVYLKDATAVSWNTATQFTSSLGATYSPSSSVSMTVPNYDTNTGTYYVTIPITASDTGSASNAVAGAIRNMSPKPPTFMYCTNISAVDGGLDSESDLDLINRAQNVWAQRGNGSIPTAEKMATDQPYVADAVAFDADDNTNGIYMGSVCDIWTQFGSLDSQLIEEYVYWPGIGYNSLATPPNVAPIETFNFVLKQQPVSSQFTPLISRFDASTGLVETPGINTGESLVLTKDTGTFQGSVQANDTLSLSLSVDTRTVARKLKIYYLKDNNPYKLQSVFDDPSNRMSGPSVLVKNAIAVPVRIIVVPTLTFGSTSSIIQAAITSNLQIYFNGGTTSYGAQMQKKTIGQSVYHSDISAVVLRTSGVVSYDENTFRVINILTNSFDDPVNILPNQYAVLNDVLFTYNSASLSNFTASFNS